MKKSQRCLVLRGEHRSRSAIIAEIPGWAPPAGLALMTFQFSRRLAILIGIAAPSIETVRRWHELRTLTVWWPAYLDDVLLGGFLLYGAWRAGTGRPHGRAVLTAAWGFMCGIAYGSVFGQLATLGQPDPSGFSPPLVVAFKALGLALGVAGLVSGLRPDDRGASE